MADVFISHSSKDKSIADAICTALEVNRIRCWIAPRDICPGQDWPEAIVNAITECHVMVLIFSSNSSNSKEISKEVTLAMNSKVTIIPFRIEDIPLEGDMKYHLINTHWLDAMNPPTENEIMNIIKTVSSILENKDIMSPDDTFNLSGQPAYKAAETKELFRDKRQSTKSQSSISIFQMGILFVMFISLMITSFLVFKGLNSDT